MTAGLATVLRGARINAEKRSSDRTDCRGSQRQQQRQQQPKYPQSELSCVNHIIDHDTYPIWQSADRKENGTNNNRGSCLHGAMYIIPNVKIQDPFTKKSADTGVDRGYGHESEYKPVHRTAWSSEVYHDCLHQWRVREVGTVPGATLVFQLVRTLRSPAATERTTRLRTACDGQAYFMNHDARPMPIMLAVKGL